LTAAPGCVPDLPTDLVEGRAGPLADVERLKAEGGVGAALADHGGDPGGGVGAHQSDGGTTAFPQLVEELPERRLVPAHRRPDQPVAVVIDDHGEVAMTPLVRDLVHPEPRQPGEAIDLGLGVRAHPGDDPAHHPPADPEQLTDRRLGGPHRQPGDGVVEGSGVPGSVARPGHPGDHHPVLGAEHPGCLRLDDGAHHPQIEVPPAPPTLAPIFPPTPLPALPAAPLVPAAEPHRHHQGGRRTLAGLLEDDVLHTIVPCTPSSRAHTLIPRTPFRLLLISALNSRKG
jgi:hypothetical protein